MTVIAISHEVGTYGNRVGRLLAQRLGLEFVPKGAIEAGIAERLMAARPATPGHVAHTALTDCELARLSIDEAQSLAASGGKVLRGWGAASVLDRSQALRVRVCASMGFRHRILSRRWHTDAPQLIQLMIEQRDASLASNLEPVLGAGWRCNEAYDLVLVMDVLSVSDAVEEIIGLLASRWAGRSHCLSPHGSRSLTSAPVPGSRPGSSIGAMFEAAFLARAERLLYDRDLLSRHVPMAARSAASHHGQ